MSRLSCVADADAIVKRRALVPAGHVIEAWNDLYTPGHFWLGEDSKRLLDSFGDVIAPVVTLPASAVAVYYGPQLTDLDSLPPEDSLKARVLSGHGIAAAWITLDRFGERMSHEPKGLTDPIFHLRRRGGGAGHLWRLFTTKREAVVYMAEAYGKESEGAEWAETLKAEDFETLLKGHASDAAP
ncbi:MAG: hypothetical protein DMD91_19210 [Candidatus Rokuibacteriota bacterium]|nr:MAG: hypothetical protein DMD91_19210 [Candidatus Rokubacteria bacterium]